MSDLLIPTLDFDSMLVAVAFVAFAVEEIVVACIVDAGNLVVYSVVVVVFAVGVVAAAVVVADPLVSQAVRRSCYLWWRGEARRNQ